MAANPTALSFVGIAKEATPNTFVASTQYLPVNKFDPQDTTMWLTNDSWRGSMGSTYDKVAGPLYTEIACGGPAIPDMIGFLCTGILGDVTTTGASAPFTHAISLKNSSTGQPVSYSLNDFDSVDNRGYGGCQVYDLKFTWDGEKALMWDGNLKGYPSAVQTKPTAAYTAVQLLPGWLSIFTIGGSGALTLVDAEIDFKRAGGPIHTADGTQAPYQIFVGPLTVTGKVTVVADTSTQLTNYLAGTKTSLDFNFTQGAGAGLTQFKAHMTNANYDLAKPNRGKEWVEYEITYEAVMNSTDAGASGGTSPIKVTLQNALPAATYL